MLIDIDTACFIRQFMHYVKYLKGSVLLHSNYDKVLIDLTHFFFKFIIVLLFLYTRIYISDSSTIPFWMCLLAYVFRYFHSLFRVFCFYDICTTLSTLVFQSWLYLYSFCDVNCCPYLPDINEITFFVKVK